MRQQVKNERETETKERTNEHVRMKNVENIVLNGLFSMHVTNFELNSIHLFELHHHASNICKTLASQK